MKRYLLAGALAGAFSLPIGAHAAPTVTIGDALFCGPTSGNGCEDGTEIAIKLNDAKNVTSGTGLIGGIGPNKVDIPIDFKSDGGSLNMFVDLSNGFATVKPAQGDVDFNGLDINVPGFLITKLIFDVKLTPFGGNGALIPFIIAARDRNGGSSILDSDNLASDLKDSDNEWSVAALNGTGFEDVNISAITGFDQIRHFEVEVTPLVAIPEPRTWALMGVGFAIMAFFGLRRRKNRLATI